MASWLDKLFRRSSGKSTHRPVREARKTAASRSADDARPGLSLVDDAPNRRQGFDPYNSGSFKPANAWERVVRR